MSADIKLSERIKKINPSSTLAITAKAKKLISEGKDVINLAAGEPDFDTPDFIKDAAILAIKSGFTKYTPSTGTPELKKAISAKFLKDNSLDYQASQIVVSCGAKHSIFNALFTVVDPGDEVLIPCPYWVSYPEMVNLCDGVTKFIPTPAKNNYKVSAGDLEKFIGPKTKIFILNTPSNPTGCVYSRKELEEIAEICVKKNIIVISDEVYEKLIYDNLKHVSIASLNKDIYKLTITVNGLSKSHSMTGWRIGFLGAVTEIVEAVSKLQDHTTSNPTSISQKAALAALSAANDFSLAMSSEFQKRRNYLLGRLDGIKEISYVAPQGAFYLFCDISKLNCDASVFANRLLEEALVSLIPGDGFGLKNHIRISFATSLKQLEVGMNRIEEWIKKL